MMQGKPAGETDAVTNRAIHDLMKDLNESPEPIEARAPRPRAAAMPDDIGPTRPAHDPNRLERRQAARFTAVPPSAADPVLPVPQAQADSPDGESAEQELIVEDSAPRRKAMPKPDLSRLAAIDLRSALAHVTRKRVALAILALIVVFRPWWIVLAVVLALFAVTGLFMGFDADRIWETVLTSLQKFEERHPERGTRLRARLDRFAERWDKLLDRMPDGMVDRLYMPDFSGRGAGADKLDAVLEDRFARLREQI